VHDPEDGSLWQAYKLEHEVTPNRPWYQFEFPEKMICGEGEERNDRETLSCAVSPPLLHPVNKGSQLRLGDE
jgi:hypothetical protein